MMTRDEILNMPAGDYLDLLIAEEIMMLQHGSPYADKQGFLFVAGKIVKNTKSWSPSTDIVAAWEVAEKMFSCYWDLTLEAGSRSPLSMATFYRTTDQISFLGSAETAPLAICRAALLAVMEI